MTGGSSVVPGSCSDPRVVTTMPSRCPLSLPRLVPLEKMQVLTVLLASAGVCLGLLVAPAEGTDLAQPAAQPAAPRRQKRDWIWNQMHIDEEKNTSLPHYVGKVRLRPPSRSGISVDSGGKGGGRYCGGCRGGDDGCEGEWWQSWERRERRWRWSRSPR